MQKNSKKFNVVKFITNLFFITIGAIITALALDTFLLANSVIDGGIIGISMIITKVTSLNLGLLIILLNTPFILLAFKKMGPKFVFQTAYANIILALAVNFFQNFKITEDILLATVFGGIILGAGVGTILKNEASLDGTEILSLLISKRFCLSVG